MTSYEKRKAEIRKLKEERSTLLGELTTFKQLTFAICKGQYAHALMLAAHFEKTHTISTRDVEILKLWIEAFRDQGVKVETTRELEDRIY